MPSVLSTDSCTKFCDELRVVGRWYTSSLASDPELSFSSSISKSLSDFWESIISSLSLSVTSYSSVSDSS